jgi:hypothetical protein
MKLLERYKMWVWISLLILWIYPTVCALQAFMIPIHKVNHVVDNQIKQTARYDYQTELRPNTLYTNRELLKPEFGILSKITSSILIHLNFAVTAKKDVVVQGTQSIVMTLIADQLWHRDYFISEKKAFEQEGSNISIYNEDIKIDVGNMLDFIAKVEKEIELKPQKYTLKITPAFGGSILYGNQKIPLESSFELNFEYTNNIFKLVGKTEYAKENNIEENVIVPQRISYLGQVMPITAARTIFILISAVLFLMMAGLLIMSKQQKQRNLTDAQRIDLKYGKRFLPLEQNIHISNKNRVVLQSIHSLVQLADEREQALFRFEQQENHHVIYYVLDGEHIYCYEASNAAPYPLDNKMFVEGKGLPL